MNRHALNSLGGFCPPPPPRKSSGEYLPGARASAWRWPQPVLSRVAGTGTGAASYMVTKWYKRAESGESESRWYPLKGHDIELSYARRSKHVLWLAAMAGWGVALQGPLSLHTVPAHFSHLGWKVSAFQHQSST